MIHDERKGFRLVVSEMAMLRKAYQKEKREIGLRRGFTAGV